MKDRPPIKIITIGEPSLTPHQAWWFGYKFKNIIKDFYKDPKNMAEFEAWQAEKNSKKEAEEASETIQQSCETSAN